MKTTEQLLNDEKIRLLKKIDDLMLFGPVQKYSGKEMMDYVNNRIERRQEADRCFDRIREIDAELQSLAFTRSRRKSTRVFSTKTIKVNNSEPQTDDELNLFNNKTES